MTQVTPDTPQDNEREAASKYALWQSYLPWLILPVGVVLQMFLELVLRFSEGPSEFFTYRSTMMTLLDWLVLVQNYYVVAIPAAIGGFLLVAWKKIVVEGKTTNNILKLCAISLGSGVFGEILYLKCISMLFPPMWALFWGPVVALLFIGLPALYVVKLTFKELLPFALAYNVLFVILGNILWPWLPYIGVLKVTHTLM